LLAQGGGYFLEKIMTTTAYSKTCHYCPQPSVLAENNFTLFLCSGHYFYFFIKTPAERTKLMLSMNPVDTA
jgi:hypothetical protein